MSFKTKAAAPLLLSLSAVGLATAPASPALAIEYVSYSGANCLPQHEDYNIKRNSNGSMTNHSLSVDHIWECPIADRGLETLKYAFVKVFDQGPGNSQPFVCSLKAIRADGTGAQTLDETTDGLGHQELKWDNGLNTTGTSNISLRCRVPRKGGIGASGVLHYGVAWD